MFFYSSFQKEKNCACELPQRMEEDDRYPGTGGMGSCEPPGRVLGNEPKASKEQQLHFNFIFTRNKLLFISKNLITGCFESFF